MEGLHHGDGNIGGRVSRGRGVKAARRAPLPRGYLATCSDRACPGKRADSHGGGDGRSSCGPRSETNSYCSSNVRVHEEQTYLPLLGGLVTSLADENILLAYKDKFGQGGLVRAQRPSLGTEG